MTHGAHLRKMKDPQKAIEQYRRVEAMPDSVEAHFGLASLLEQYNQLTEAADAYRGLDLTRST